jgi:hypothetical protein
MTTTSLAASANDVATAGKPNPVGQLVGYVKTSVVRTVDGCQELWSNHGRCNEIRKKMSQHRALVQEQWESEAVDSGVTMTKQDIKQRLKSVQGGITYDDYIFLQKGKEDRGKVLNMGFLMWGAPKFLPYAMMFNPDMLPSPFQSVIPTTETSAQKLSRERSAAVIETLLAMEKNVVVNGMFAKMNIFGGKKREEQKAQLADITSRTASLMRAPQMQAATNTAVATNTGAGASLVLQQLESHLYSATEFTKSEKRCNQVPACIAKGLGNVIGGGGMFAAIAPSFLARGKVMGHIKKVADADEFITQSDIDLKSINKRLLKEACNERLIGGPNRSEDELRSNLQDWLNLVVTQPAARLQKAAAANGAGPDPASSSASSLSVPSLYYNENLARLALMGYYSCVSVRDARSASVLPRLLFGGSSIQQGSSTSSSGSEQVGEVTAKRKFFSRSQ